MTQQNKTAIITGASKGIGASIAKRLAEDGFAVVVNYSRSADEAKKLVREIEKKGGRAISVQADVGDSNAVRQLFDRAEAEFGNLNVDRKSVV